MIKLPSTPPSLRPLALKAYLKRLSLDDKPILVGPWRSELGFEVLYWLPFLHYCAERVPKFWERAVIVTRGGGAVLYPAEKAVDLFSLRSIEEFRVQNNNDQLASGLQKQMRVTAWDRDVLKDAFVRATYPGRQVSIHGQAEAQLVGVGGRYHVLHPSWMYWTLEPFWNADRGVRYATDLLRFHPIVAPDAKIEGLPEKFIAVRFYARPTFPDNPVTRDFVARMVGRLSAHLPVVLLNQPQLHVDDHHDIPVVGPNVMQAPAFPAEENIGYMAAVLSRASMFVGTYGGVAQLALRMRIPSISIFTAFHSTAHAHRDLNHQVSIWTGVPFVTMSVGEVGLTKIALRERVPVQAEHVA